MKAIKPNLFTAGMIIGIFYSCLLNIYFSKTKVNSEFEHVEYTEYDVDPGERRGVSWAEEKIVYKDSHVQFINAIIEQDFVIKLVFSALMYSILEFIYNKKIKKDVHNRFFKLKSNLRYFFIGFTLSTFPTIFIKLLLQ